MGIAGETSAVYSSSVTIESNVWNPRFLAAMMAWDQGARKGSGVLIVLCDEAIDGRLEVDAGSEHAMLEVAACELGEETLHGIKPGRPLHNPQAVILLQESRLKGVQMRRDLRQVCFADDR